MVSETLSKEQHSLPPVVSTDPQRGSFSAPESGNKFQVDFNWWNSFKCYNWISVLMGGNRFWLSIRHVYSELVKKKTTTQTNKCEIARLLSELAQSITWKWPIAGAAEVNLRLLETAGSWTVCLINSYWVKLKEFCWKCWKYLFSACRLGFFWVFVGFGLVLVFFNCFFFYPPSLSSKWSSSPGIMLWDIPAGSCRL